MRINNNAAIRYGNEALLYFQNLMVIKFKSDYSDTLPELKNKLLDRNENFLIEFGQIIYKSKLGQRRVEEGMERVVAKIKAPNDAVGIMAFSNGITEELSSFDFSILGDVAIDIANDAVEKLDETSDSLMSFFKNWGWTIPIVVIAVVALFFGFKDSIIKKVLG